MKNITTFCSSMLLILLVSCNNQQSGETMKPLTQPQQPNNMTETKYTKNGYAAVNGLNMYYEMYGTGNPLVLIHGGGSTIQSNFGKIIPILAKKHQLIVMELQAHGRTADREQALSFEQDADDIAALLNTLQIKKADVLGFSNGGQTAMVMALRHPELINRLILASAFFSRDGVFPQFWDIFKNADLKNMPQPLKDGFLMVNNDPAALLKMFNRDVERMQHFKGWSETQLRSIKAPTLVMNGSKDVATVEHALRMHRLIPNSDLAIMPGLHGQYLGEISTLQNGRWDYHYGVEIIEEFLDASTH